MSETIEIPVSEYRQLVEDSQLLMALFSVGVDNWEGYTLAQEAVENE